MTRTRLGIGWLALLAASLGSCRPEAETKPTANLLLITIDTLRADHLGCYGYDRATSPAIDRLAARGATFDTAVAQAPWTFASVPSLISSRYPQTQERIVLKSGPFTLLRPTEMTLGERLKAAGFATSFVSGHLGLKRIARLTEGMDHTEWLARNAELVGQVAETELMRLSSKQEPFFLWVYFNDSHAPYTPPGRLAAAFEHDGRHPTGKILPFGTQRYDAIGSIPTNARLGEHQEVDYYVAQYDGTIAFVDEAVGRLLARLSAAGLDDKTVVILHADHGERLGEDGRYFSHGGTLAWANLHVPWLVSWPGHIPAGARIPAVAELVDLVPTALELLGVRPGKLEAVGRSQAACLVTPARCTPGTAFAVAGRAGPTDEYAVVKDGELLRCEGDAACSLTDPATGTELTAARPAAARNLGAALGTWKTRHPARPVDTRTTGLDLETKETLRALGYVPDVAVVPGPAAEP